MEFTLKYGLFGLRRVKLRFDLAALKAATVAARMDLGEFFTSERLSEDDRLFFHVFGAWLNGSPVTVTRLKKFSKFYRGLKQKQVEKIKHYRIQSEIVSREFKQALEKTGDSKKKT